jgi:predicted ATPase
VFLDDLHWADAATIAVLGFLLRHAEESGFAFIATARSGDARGPLRSLLNTLEREGRLERIVLNRLSPPATHALAQQLSPVFAWPLADWLERSGEGSPYVIAELVQHARDQRLLLADGTLDLSALAATPLVPQTVAGLIRTRIAQLSPDARRVLDAAAVIGREFEFEVVAEAALLNDEQAVDALEELHQLRLVRPIDGLRYSLDHSLTLEVVQHELSAPRLRLLHRRMGEAIERVHHGALDALAGTIASHFARGGAKERSAHYALIAGRQAAALAAWHEAIGFYQLAINGQSGSERQLAQVLLGEALFNAGELTQAETTLRAVLAETSGNEQRNAARLALARVLLVQTRLAEAVELARAVEGAQNPSTAIGARFIIGTALSLEGANLDQAETELHAAAAALANTELVDDAALRAQVVFELGNIAAQRGELLTAVERYREVIAIGDAAGDEVALEWRILGRNNLAYHLHLLGDTQASEHLAQGMQIAVERGALSFQPYLFSTQGELALSRHALQEAEQSFQQGLTLATRLALAERIAGLTANLGLVARAQQREAEAIYMLREALRQAEQLGTRHLAARIHLWLVPLLEPQEALQHLVAARAIAEQGRRSSLLAEIAALTDELSIERSASVYRL